MQPSKHDYISSIAYFGYDIRYVENSQTGACRLRKFASNGSG
jgi:hypothetical protein